VPKAVISDVVRAPKRGEGKEGMEIVVAKYIGLTFVVRLTHSSVEYVTEKLMELTDKPMGELA